MPVISRRTTAQKAAQKTASNEDSAFRGHAVAIGNHVTGYLAPLGGLLAPLGSLLAPLGSLLTRPSDLVTRPGNPLARIAPPLARIAPPLARLGHPFAWAGHHLARWGRYLTGLSWPFRPRWLDVGWAVFSAINLIAILVFANWETIPFHFIWISFTLLYGFRTWPARPTMWVLAVVMATTGAGIALDVIRDTEPAEELTEVPLMAAMFVAMVWHARRKLAAEQQSLLVSDQNARLLDTQRRFLQDASHQLRTPITIALGHAELLASDLSGHQETQDIQVVLGELTRLRRIAERLLVIAAADDPEFLHPEPITLDSFVMDVLRRWRPTAERRWQLGRLDKVTIQADRERLGLAIDALLENAVRHTADGDVIKLSVAASAAADVRITVADGGCGIPAELLPHVFDRFRSGDSQPSRGTGLGLALVRAVARAHGGDVLVRSRPEQGSEFELLLPSPTGSRAAESHGTEAGNGGWRGACQSEPGRQPSAK